MLLSMFSQEGVGNAAAGIPRELEIFENLASNSLPTSHLSKMCVKNPLNVP